MNEVARPTRPNVFEARLPNVRIRAAVSGSGDLAFVDALQKAHSKQVGFLHRKALETYIEKGKVLIAEEVSGQESELSDQQSEVGEDGLTSDRRPLLSASPLGYIIGTDRYQKRDEVGIIYQLNVAPGSRRKLVGAMLVKAMFERAAYGCRLFCCWCAQDIEANHFWESIGFVPLAFRTGSRTRGKAGQPRIHIFWQKRICEGDSETPWWFPSVTGGGSIRSDRLAIPIPPGTHWSDPMPVLLPDPEMTRALDGDSKGASKRRRLPGKKVANAPQPINDEKQAAKVRAQSKHLMGCPPGKMAVFSGGKVKYIDRPGQDQANSPEPSEEEKVAEREEAKRARREAQKEKRRRERAARHDPKHVAMARELRDRFLEHVNTPGSGFELSACEGKYDVSRPRIIGPAESEMFSSAKSLPGDERGSECDTMTADVIDRRADGSRFLDAA